MLTMKKITQKISAFILSWFCSSAAARNTWTLMKIQMLLLNRPLQVCWHMVPMRRLISTFNVSNITSYYVQYLASPSIGK